MKKTLEMLRSGSVAGAAYRYEAPGVRNFMPQIAFAPDDGTGTGDKTDDDKTEEEKAGIAASLAAAEKAKKDADDAAAAAAAAAAGGKPSDKEAELLKDVMKQKEAAKAAKAEAEALAAQLKAFEGIDPAAVRAMLDEQKTRETKELEAKGEWERVKGIMVEAHTTELKTLQDQIKDLQSQIAGRDSELNEVTIGNQFVASKFIGEDLTIGASHARKLYGSNFQRENGKIVGYEKPVGSADNTPIVGATGEPLAFEDALRHLVEKDPERDRLKRSKAKPGSGGGTTPANQGAKQQETQPTLSGAASISAALAARAAK